MVEGGGEGVIMNLMRVVAAALIRVYQGAISPFFPQTCRFYPTCSHYAREAISRYGVLLGMRLAMARILRCHPWHPGGYDPVPDDGLQH